MKLNYPLFGKPLELGEDHAAVLVVENARELRKIIISLQRQTENEPGEFILSENNEKREISKLAVLITDPFSLEFDSRRLSNKINQAAVQASADFAEQIQKLLRDINALAADISTRLDFAADFEEIDSPDVLIKLLNYRIDKEEMDFAEQLLEYMKLRRRFFGEQLFIIYNLKACLDSDELRLFYKTVRYEKLIILLIEDRQRETVGGDCCEERTLIIDEDLCLI